MATEMKKEYWTDVIQKTPSIYERKFVVHTDTDILFASDNMMEAENFLKINRSNYLNISGVFFVPHDFGAIRLRMLKIKSLTTGEWTPMHEVKFIFSKKEGSYFYSKRC